MFERLRAANTPGIRSRTLHLNFVRPGVVVLLLTTVRRNRRKSNDRRWSGCGHGRVRIINGREPQKVSVQNGGTARSEKHESRGNRGGGFAWIVDQFPSAVDSRATRKKKKKRKKKTEKWKKLFDNNDDAFVHRGND